MQVIIFDKFFKCLYRLRDIPNDWHFDKVHKLLELKHKPSDYQAIRLADFDDFCTDDYVWDGENLKLTCSDCT